MRLDCYFLKQIDVFGKKLQTSLEKIITYGAIDKPNFRPQRNSSLRTPAKNKQHYPPLTAVGRYRKLNYIECSRLSKYQQKGLCNCFISYDNCYCISIIRLLNSTTKAKLLNSTTKAKLLNDQFQRAFSKSVPMKLKHIAEQATNGQASGGCYPSMPPINITVAGVEKLLNKLIPIRHLVQKTYSPES